MSYNTSQVLGGVTPRSRNIGEFLVDIDFDIVGLNEMYNPTYRKLILNDERIKERYPYRIFNLAKLPIYEAGGVILSKYPITSSDRYEFKSSPRGISSPIVNLTMPPKDVTFAEIKISRNLKIGVFLVHLSSSKFFCDYRIKQITELQDFIVKKGYGPSERDMRKKVIIMGDFNVYGETDSKFGDFGMVEKLKVELNVYDALMTIDNQKDHLQVVLEYLPQNLKTGVLDSSYTWDATNNSFTFLEIEQHRFDLMLTDLSVVDFATLKVTRNLIKQHSLKSFFDTDRIEIDEIVINTIITPFLMVLFLLLQVSTHMIRLLKLTPYDFSNRGDLSDHHPIIGIFEI